MSQTTTLPSPIKVMSDAEHVTVAEDSLEITVNPNTRQRLQTIAAQVSTPDKPLDANQIATVLLDTVARKVPAQIQGYEQLVKVLNGLQMQPQ